MWRSSKLWRKFKKDKLLILSICFLAVLFFLSIFGYVVAPEKTAEGNDQKPALQFRESGESVFILKEKNEITSWTELFFGQKNMREISYIDSCFEKDDILYYRRIQSEQWEKTTKNGVQYELDSRIFLFGTDILGRDVWSRLIIGTRISLFVGIVAAVLSILIGTILGLISGYYGGKIDAFILWIINVFWTLPTILLAMVFVVKLRTSNLNSLWLVCAAIGLTMWVDIARLIRGLVIEWKERQFVEASRALGFSDMRILLRHIFPNTIPSILIMSSSIIASAIALEAGMSYLGMGVKPPNPSWGGMLREYYGYLGTDMAYLAFIPGVAIMMTILAFIFIGNGLRDCFDIKLD